MREHEEIKREIERREHSNVNNWLDTCLAFHSWLLIKGRFTVSTTFDGTIVMTSHSILQSTEIRNAIDVVNKRCEWKVLAMITIVQHQHTLSLTHAHTLNYRNVLTRATEELNRIECNDKIVHNCRLHFIRCRHSYAYVVVHSFEHIVLLTMRLRKSLFILDLTGTLEVFSIGSNKLTLSDIT